MIHTLFSLLFFIAILKKVEQPLMRADFEVAMTLLHQTHRDLTASLMMQLMDSISLTKKKWLAILEKHDPCDRSLWFNVAD